MPYIKLCLTFIVWRCHSTWHHDICVSVLHWEICRLLCGWPNQDVSQMCDL